MKYTSEQKQDFISKWQKGEATQAICTKHNIPKSTFYSWAKLFSPISTEIVKSITKYDFELLKPKSKKQENIITIMHTVDCGLDSPLQVKLTELEKLHGQYDVHTLCEALNVSRGTYYNHIFRNKRENTTYKERRDELRLLIKEIFEENRQLFGVNKIKSLLNERGVKVSREMVAELMSEMDLQSVRPNSKDKYKKLKWQEKQNILSQGFYPERPNQIWVSDVTCFKVKEKYQYICVILDLFSRKVIAYNISLQNSTQLITTTFKRVINSRTPNDSLMFHSDQGSQYTSKSFTALLRKNGIVQSFSNPGVPYNNSVAESFFASLKREEIYRTNYLSEADFIKRIEEYIIFYNEKRPHKTLAYRTPNKFESNYFLKHKTGQESSKVSTF